MTDMSWTRDELMEKPKVDWEKRALSIVVDYAGTPGSEKQIEHQTRDVLQLGREMAAEARDSEREELKRLGADMADARAEEIAKAIEERKTPWNTLLQGETLICAGIARATIKKSEPPKTREQVLEEALKKIREEPTFSPDAKWMREIAERALEAE